MSDKPERTACDDGGSAAGFERIIELSRGFWAPRVLLTAIELDLFTTLGKQELAAAELAARLPTDVRGTELLANALVSLELLSLDDGRYANQPLALSFLDAASPQYRGHAIRLASLLWQRWSQLTSIVQQGADGIGPDWDEKEIGVFTLAMHQGKPQAAEALLGRLDLQGVRRIIDLGGGSGTFSEALVLALPKAQVVLVDRPQVIAVARSRIAADLLDQRIVLVERDFIVDGVPLAGDPPAPYDLALLSSVLHIYGAQENAALMGAVYEALEPGGRIVIREFVAEADGTAPPEAALFAVNMLVNTTHGRCYSFDEIRGWLHKAGFGEVELQPLDRSIGLITARRA
ncbi:MAG: methyltransferase [Acidobacteriota bacterium]